MRRAASLFILLLAVPLGAYLPARPAKAMPAVHWSYIHRNGGPNEIVAVEQQGDGSLAALPGSPFGTNNAVFPASAYAGSVAISHKKGLVFSGGANGISVHQIGVNGSLGLVSGSPFGAVPVLGVTVAEIDGNTYVYGSDPDNALVHIFRASRSGTLTPISGQPVVIIGEPAGMATARRLIFFAMRTGKLIVCKIKQSGSLAGISGYPKDLGQPGLNSLAVDPEGKVVYLPGVTENKIFGFSIGKTGKAKRVPGSPLTTGLDGAVGLTNLAMGKSAFFPVGTTADSVTNELSAGRRTKTGAPRLVGPMLDTPMAGVRALGADRSGRFYLAVEAGAAAVRPISVDPSTGAIQIGPAFSIAGFDTGITGIAITEMPMTHP